MISKISKKISKFNKLKKFKRATMLSALGSIFLISSLHAETNLMNCESNENTLFHCKVNELVIFQENDKEKFEQEFVIPYKFSCTPGRSDKVKIAVVDSSGKEVYLEFGKSGEIRLDGHPPVKLVDKDTGKTYKSLFNSGCVLSIDTEATKYYPSSHTLDLWRSEAQLQTKLISFALKNYLTIKDLAKVITWTQGQLTSLESSVKDMFESALATINLSFKDISYSDDYEIVEQRGTIKDLCRLNFANINPNTIDLKSLPAISNFGGKLYSIVNSSGNRNIKELNITSTEGTLLQDIKFDNSTNYLGIAHCNEVTSAGGHALPEMIGLPPEFFELLSPFGPYGYLVDMIPKLSQVQLTLKHAPKYDDNSSLEAKNDLIAASERGAEIVARGNKWIEKLTEDSKKLFHALSKEIEKASKLK
ncbi:MAG: hypothetical protein HQK51_10195 [Oligoflexia bacterium]|nr:hypothetical protein [Oligoflexia bacterium]